MGIMKALLDTNIVIDILAAYPPALQEIALYSEAAISRITWMEVLIGAPDPNCQALWEAFLDQFEIIEINQRISREAIKLRQQYRVKLPDAIIWASAIEYGANVVTRNTKDFDPSKPSVHIPYIR